MGCELLLNSDDVRGHVAAPPQTCGSSLHTRAVDRLRRLKLLACGRPHEASTSVSQGIVGRDIQCKRNVERGGTGAAIPS